MLEQSVLEGMLARTEPVIDCGAPHTGEGPSDVSTLLRLLGTLLLLSARFEHVISWRTLDF